MFLLFFSHEHCLGGVMLTMTAASAMRLPEVIATSHQSSGWPKSHGPISLEWQMTGGYAQLQLRDYSRAMAYFGEMVRLAADDATGYHFLAGTLCATALRALPAKQQQKFNALE